MKTLNDICIVEDKILTKMEGYFSPKPFYLIGGNNSGKTGFLWRLQEIIKDRTRITDLVILSNKNDFGYKYEDGPKTLREAFGRDVDLFDKILDCDWVAEYLLEYCGIQDPHEALDYYNEHDWRFIALVATVSKIIGRYVIHTYDKKRIVFALDDFGSIFNESDLRDVFIYRLMEILHKRYGKLESMVLITTNHNNHRFWTTMSGADDESLEYVCCGDKYFITDEDKHEYLKFLSDIKDKTKKLSQLEVQLLCKMERCFAPQPFYIFGKSGSGKSLFIKRLEHLMKHYTRATNLITLSNNDNDFIPDWIYRDGSISLKDALDNDREMFENILYSDYKLAKYWAKYIGQETVDGLYTYNAGDDYSFTAMLRVIQAIKTYYDRNKDSTSPKRVILVLDNFNSKIKDDMRDLLIAKYLEVLDTQYEHIEVVLVITSQDYDDKRIYDIQYNYKDSGVYCIDHHVITEEESNQYKEFINNLSEGDKEKMDIKAKLNESTELLNEAENEINTVKDIVIVAGMFDKDRDVEELTSILDTKSCGTLLIHKLDDCIILGGTASREWSTKAKATDWNKKDNEFLVVLDINGPLFKKCTFLDLSRACEVLESSGLIDMVSSFIKSKR